MYTFGCNDEGALGRQVEDEDECMTPGKVELPVNLRVVSVSAGDSHTAMLTHDGRVFIWGTFRVSQHFVVSVTVYMYQLAEILNKCINL